MLPTVTIFLFSVLCGIAAEPKSPLFSPRCYLVHAKARLVKCHPKSDPKGIAESAIFVIDRVYVGSDRLKGKEFTVKVPGDSFMHFDDYKDRKRDLIKNEEGVWWITEDPSDHALLDRIPPDVFPRSSSLDWWSPRFPYRDPKRIQLPDRKSPDLLRELTRANAHYQLGLRWAEAMEVVYRTQSKAEQVEILKKYAATKNSPVAAWAIWTLGKVKPAHPKRFLLELTENHDLSIWSQTILDEELCRTERQAWKRSQRRLEMLQRWVKKDIPDPDQYTEGTSRIRSILRDDELDCAAVLQVFKAGMTTIGKLSKEQKREYTGLLEQIHPFEAPDKRLLFDYLIELVQSSDSEVRNTAASALRHASPFDTRQLRTLRNIGERVCDPKTIKLLDQAPYESPRHR